MTSFVACAGCGAPSGGAYRCVRCLQADRGPVARAGRGTAVALRAPAPALSGVPGPSRIWVVVAVVAVLALATVTLRLVAGSGSAGIVTVSTDQAAADVRTFYVSHQRPAATVSCTQGPVVKGVADDACRASVGGAVEDITVHPTDRSGHYRLTLTGTG